MREFRPWQVSMIPFYHLSKDATWADDYGKVEALQEKLEKLEAALADVKNPLDKETFLKYLKSCHDDHYASRMRRLAAQLEVFRGCPEHVNPVGGLRYSDTMAPDKVPTGIPFQDIEAAIETMVEGISYDDREKQIESITAEVEKTKKQIVKLSPEKFFLLDKARAIVDSRAVFIDTWRGLQADISAAITPVGRCLELYGSETERKIWLKLIGEDYVGGGLGSYTPFRGEYS